MATLFGTKSFIVVASLASFVAFAAGCTQGNYPASCLQSNGGDCKTCTPGEKTSCFDGTSVADANKLQDTLKGQQELGQCRAGTKVCLPDSTWSTCDGAVGPSAEVCGNQIDDDCNGLIDSKDSRACSCNPGETRKQFRDVDGNLVYDVPSGVSHVVHAKTSNPKTGCTYCIQTCSGAGTWGNEDGGCVPKSPAKDDICNEIDDDCDGLIDEDMYKNGNSNAAKGDVCDVGTGACQRFGRLKCAPLNSVICDVSAGTSSISYSDSPASNGSWDHNCDGKVEVEVTWDYLDTTATTDGAACTRLSGCTNNKTIAFGFSAIQCGLISRFTQCRTNAMGDCIVQLGTSSSGAFRCK